MLFGHSARPWESPEKEIGLISGMGLDIIEFVIEPPKAEASMLIADADRIKSWLAKHRLRAYGHAPSFISLGSSEIVERASSILTVQHAIDAAAAIGIEKLVVHASQPGYAMLSPKEREKERKRTAESFSFLHSYGKKKNVVITAENFSDSPEEFFMFLKKVDGLGMAFDVAHAFMSGGMKYISAFLEKAELIEHMHVHDNHGQGDEHIALGKGKLDTDRFLHELKKSRYDKSMTFEIFSGSREKGVKESLELVRKGLGI